MYTLMISDKENVFKQNLMGVLIYNINNFLEHTSYISPEKNYTWAIRNIFWYAYFLCTLIASTECLEGAKVH